MIPAETIKEMEEFREANQKYMSHEWALENRTNSDSPRQLYTRKIEHHPPPPVVRPNRPSTSSSSSHLMPWFDDPELKRQRRVVKYKAYAVEGKMKASFRSGFRWVKSKYNALVHG